MSETKTASPPPRKRRSWLRVVGILFATFLVLLVAAYFIATSSGFVKGVILPRVSKSLNADVTVSSVSLHPFREVVLHDLKVQAKGEEPIVTAPEVRAHYHLLEIIRGNIHVDDVTLTSPTILLVENPDGSHNYDAFGQNKSGKAGERKGQKESSKPAQIDLRKLSVNNATVRQVKLYQNGQRDETQLANLNASLENVKNGQTGKLALSADLKMENHPPAPGTNGSLQGAIKGDFTFALTPDLKPGSVQGGARLSVSQAGGALGDLADFASDLKCDVTPTDIRQVALQFQKGNAALGELRASGPFDAAKSEGRVHIELVSVDKRLLNLLGAKSGIDFGSTTISSTHDLQLTNSGALIVAVGRVDLGKLQLTRTNQTTPTLDVSARYDVTVNRAQSNATLRALTLTGTQNGKPLLQGELTSPMTLAWGNASNSVGDSALNLAVTGLNLPDWKPFLGDSIADGSANLKAHIVSQQGGKRLAFELDSQIANLTAGAGSNRISQADVTLTARGEAADLKQFKLTEYNLQLAQQKQAAVSVTGSGTYDATTQSAEVEMNLRATLAALFPLLGQPDLNASGGTAELQGHVAQKKNSQTVTGRLAVTDFTGRLGKNQFRNFGSAMDLDVRKTAEQVQLRKVAGTLTEGTNAGGSFNLSGTYGFSNQTAQLNAKFSDFNQNGLRPFLEPLLGEKQLVSVRLNGNASAQYDPHGDAAIKADVQLANLLVRDPQQDAPATPLEAKVVIDTALAKNIADVHQFQITLSPTDRAKNELRLKGRVDFSQTNAIQGNLKLEADSLDVTRYYDLFASEGKPAKKKRKHKAAAGATPAAAAEGAPDDEEEPDAKQLPFKNFVVDANIREFYLRETAATNFQTTVKIDNNRVVLNPCQLALNGAPVNATVDLDLGVPGFKYTVKFDAQQVPFAPLWNTFEPQRKGEVGGTLHAHVDIAGAGVTGVSLQKTLTGEFDVGATNLNLAVERVRLPALKAVINLVANIPQLLSNPAGALGGLFNAVENIFGGGDPGMIDELKKSPIQVISAHGNAGSGRINLQQAVVRSAAFEATANGGINIAPVLTNSPIRIPVAIGLGTNVAQRIGMAGNAPDGYVKLPDFLTLEGTLGKPERKIDHLALATGSLKGITHLIPNTGKTIGNTGAGLLQDLGGVFKGNGQNTTNAPAANTNQNQSPVNNLLNRFLGPKEK